MSSFISITILSSTSPMPSSQFACGSGALPARCVGSSRGRVKPTTTGCVRTRATGLSTDQERHSGDWPQRLLQGREGSLAGAHDAVAGLVEVDDDRDEKPEQEREDH